MPLYIISVLFGSLIVLPNFILGTTTLIDSKKVDSSSLQRHIPFIGAGKSQWNGCKQKPVENYHLLGNARACPATKPLKLSKALKKEKEICSKHWTICSVNDKAVRKLSWNISKMPKGCFAFNYGKAKAAGYGKHCHTNLYFDGVLCCPVPGSKALILQKQSPPYYFNSNEKLSLHINAVD